MSDSNLEAAFANSLRTKSEVRLPFNAFPRTLTEFWTFSKIPWTGSSPPSRKKPSKAKSCPSKTTQDSNWKSSRSGSVLSRKATSTARNWTSLRTTRGRTWTRNWWCSKSREINQLLANITSWISRKLRTSRLSTSTFCITTSISRTSQS